ncbi:MAG: homoserine dehydrogenase, partial [Kiritimatiellia bacterium]
FGKLTTILGAQGVNIRAASQREEPSDSSFVPVVVLTNAAREDAMARAVEQIKQASIAKGEPVLLRML